MRTLRCLISNLPQRLLADIVLATVKPHMNIEVVGEASIGEDLPALVKNQSIDLLLMGAKKDTLPQAVNDILDSNQDPIVICLIDDGRRAAVFFNDIGASELEELISAFVPPRKTRRIQV